MMLAARALFRVLLYNVRTTSSHNRWFAAGAKVQSRLGADQNKGGLWGRDWLMLRGGGGREVR